MRVYKNENQEADFTCYSYNERSGVIHGDFNHMYFGCEYQAFMLVYDEGRDDHMYWQGFLDAVEASNHDRETNISYEALCKMVRRRLIQLDNPENVVVTNEN